jgi:hypothetical protein
LYDVPPLPANEDVAPEQIIEGVAEAVIEGKALTLRTTEVVLTQPKVSVPVTE